MDKQGLLTIDYPNQEDKIKNKETQENSLSKEKIPNRKSRLSP